MLMEFLPGGDLMTMLIKYEIFSEEYVHWRFLYNQIDRRTRVVRLSSMHALGLQAHRIGRTDAGIAV